MTGRYRVDPVRMGEEIFYRIFHHIFNDEGARKHFEFSQINFFNNAKGLPGWNLWFQRNTKVFQLVLLGAREVSSVNILNHFSHLKKTFVEGRFLIRYFPGSEDPVLDNFSCAETLTRFSPLFDHTGTPTLDGQETLDENYFVVGYLDFRTHTGRSFVELECIAQNQWKDIRTDGLYLENSEDEQFQAVEPGGVDRRVPGWNLAFFLFDKLISGFCYTYKTEPCATVFAQKKGSQFEIDKNNHCTEKKNRGITLFHLATVIETPPCSSALPCQCVKNNADVPDMFIQTTTDRMTEQGLLISEVWGRPGKPYHPVMMPEWWTAKHLQFSSDIKAEMQHCCYHDH